MQLRMRMRMRMRMRDMQRLLAKIMELITVSILIGKLESFHHQTQQHTFCDQLILSSGYPCSQHTIKAKDGFLLGLERVSSCSSSLPLGNGGERGPPVLLLHGLFMAGTPEQSLGSILADRGFDVWVGNVHRTSCNHGHIWDWSCQELAMYDVAEMINYINSVTKSKLFVLGHSQCKKSFAAFTQPEIAEKVEAVDLVHAKGVHQLNRQRSRFRSTTSTLHPHNVLALPEDKASDPTSSFQPQQSSRQQFQDIAMGLLFVIGYACIILEEYVAFNKSGVGLLMAVSLWVIRIIGAPSTDIAVSELTHASAEVSEIVFFLLGAMTILEIVDAHQGFKLITDNITTQNPCLLLWVIGFVTFFLSSVLDSLASTIVMISLLQKLVPQSEYQKILGAVVVIAANAGGAWSPIGAVTTTMLWMHGQISALETVKGLFVPSVISLVVPLVLMSLTSGVNNGEGQNSPDVFAYEQIPPRGKLVSSVSLGALIFVPVFRSLTGLPPFMGMLLGLGMLWLLTDAIHHRQSERQKLKVPQALSKVDTQGALFFLGILLSVSSLEAAGILQEIANYFDAHVQSSELIASAIGLISAVIDNVPLVAATMGMYDVASVPQDSEFWQLIALCASTGGSILIIGSAAGVAFMGMEKVDFCWYLRKVSGFALAGYAAGIATYLALHNLNISLPNLPEV